MLMPSVNAMSTGNMISGPDWFQPDMQRLPRDGVCMECNKAVSGWLKKNHKKLHLHFYSP